MSITVNLYYTGVNGSAHRFVNEMERSGTASLIRREDGNERYEYFSSLNDPETILLIDSWIDQNAIDKHHATPMMDIIIALREKHDLHMKIERYISDEVGVPATDNQFIRE